MGKAINSETGKFVTTKERFLRKIKVNSNGCWEWQASKIKSGYGYFWMNGRKVVANRAAWMLLKGEIPNGLQVCHHCDNRGCANPEHLFLGTQKDNMADAKAKGRTYLPCPLGSEHGMSKLDEKKVRFIRTYAHKGVARKHLARLFGVHLSTIDYVLSNRGWKHVS